MIHRVDQQILNLAHRFLINYFLKSCGKHSKMGYDQKYSRRLPLVYFLLTFNSKNLLNIIQTMICIAQFQSQPTFFFGVQNPLLGSQNRVIYKSETRILFSVNKRRPPLAAEYLQQQPRTLTSGRGGPKLAAGDLQQWPRTSTCGRGTAIVTVMNAFAITCMAVKLKNVEN